MQVSTSIIPKEHVFARKPNTQHSLHFEAICVFVATGFFLDDDTYWRDLVCLTPSHEHVLDAYGYLKKSTPNFQWHYTPRNIPFEIILEEYIDILTEVTRDLVGNSSVILPLSGGLDSRSLALVLKGLGTSVHAFSYSFKNGYPEHKLANLIAKQCGFEFSSFEIPPGYLWNTIDELAEINGCYSEFTHPRQMAVLDELKKMKGVFSLGHWGDVLFDSAVPTELKESDIIPYLFKKMVKPKGLELASKLWDYWGLKGDFKLYLASRIESSLSAIKIDNLNAKVRAFKTNQWAHRWTTNNLRVFEAAHPITMPYYDNRICEFICTVPEEYLAGRRLQIAHLKKDKGIADITWQAQRPFNLNNYNFNKMPYNLPFRILNKLRLLGREFVGNSYIQRNWELQFLGSENQKYLESYLFNNDFNHWIPKNIIADFYSRFKNSDGVDYSHAISILLTLSVWYQQNLISN